MKIVTEQIANTGVFRTTSSDCDCEGLGSTVIQSITAFGRMHAQNECDVRCFASRETQREYLLDCGPQAWDDRDGGE